MSTAEENFPILFIWDAISEAFTLVCIKWHVYEKDVSKLYYIKKRSQQMARKIEFDQSSPGRHSKHIESLHALSLSLSLSLTGVGEPIALLCRRHDPRSTLTLQSISTLRKSSTDSLTVSRTLSLWDLRRSLWQRPLPLGQSDLSRTSD